MILLSAFSEEVLALLEECSRWRRGLGAAIKVEVAGEVKAVESAKVVMMAKTMMVTRWSWGRQLG